MHEFTFADVACPPRHVVLNLPLLDFTLGHRILLSRARNPLLGLDEALFNALTMRAQISALIEAVFICAQTYAENRALEDPHCPWFKRWKLNRQVKAWHRARRKVERQWERDVAQFPSLEGAGVGSEPPSPHEPSPPWGEGGRRPDEVRRTHSNPAPIGKQSGGEVSPADSGYWPVEIAKFRNYIASSRVNTDPNQFPSLEGLGVGSEKNGCNITLPCMAAEKTASDSSFPGSNRSLGAPYDAVLVQFLLKTGLCRTEAECLEYPFALAEVHYLTHLEKEGCLRILNAQEWEFAADCAARDHEAALAAGFSNAKAHFDHILREARKKVTSDECQVTSSEKTAAPSGLATSPPADLLVTSHSSHITPPT